MTTDWACISRELMETGWSWDASVLAPMITITTTSISRAFNMHQAEQLAHLTKPCLARMEATGKPRFKEER